MNSRFRGGPTSRSRLWPQLLGFLKARPRVIRLRRIRMGWGVFLPRRLHDRSSRHRWLWGMAGTAMILTTVVMFVASLRAYIWYRTQPWPELIQQAVNYKTPHSTLFYDVDGRVIGESYTANQIYTPYDEIPQQLIDATLAIEDQNFFSHRGIDLLAIARAAVVNVREGRIAQGGSTITQQLVRNYLLDRERLFSRKIREAILALKVERHLTKEEILERYLNHLFMGQNSYGVAGAARRFFSKPLSDLQLHQHALLAGLFQAPSRYNPLRHKKLAFKRRGQVLKAMYLEGKIGRKVFLVARKKKLGLSPSYEALTDAQPHDRYYIDYVTTEAQRLLGVSSLKDRGYHIHTYLMRPSSDLLHGAVRFMEDKFQRVEQINTSPFHKPRLEAAGIILNVHTGTVEAMLGGRDYEASSFNRAVQAQRALGSAFKPIVYSLALSQGFKWSDVFYIAPITLADTYRPKSAQDHELLKETTLLQSFYKSINVISMELGKKFGLSAIIEHAQKMGLSSEIKREYGSLIGQSEVNLLEMSRLYSTFAARGHRLDPVVIARITDYDGEVLYQAPPLAERRHRVMSESVNYLMVQGMSKVLSHGTGLSASSLATLAGGKTGTTNDATNNWFCGFTEDYVVVVWVGTDASTPLERGGLSGAKLALPIWQYVMKELSHHSKTQPIPAPQGVVSARIDPRFGHRSSSGITAWFLNSALPQSSPGSLTLINSGEQPLRGFGSSPRRAVMQRSQIPLPRYPCVGGCDE